MSGSDDGSADRLREFTQFRQRMNQRILAEPNQVVRRFFALDTQTYQAGALEVKTRSCSAWSPRWCCAATTASATTSPSARKRGDP